MIITDLSREPTPGRVPGRGDTAVDSMHLVTLLRIVTRPTARALPLLIAAHDSRSIRMLWSVLPG
jgi:hypothetical protein